MFDHAISDEELITIERDVMRANINEIKALKTETALWKERYNAAIAPARQPERGER